MFKFVPFDGLFYFKYLLNFLAKDILPPKHKYWSFQCRSIFGHRNSTYVKYKLLAYILSIPTYAQWEILAIFGSLENPDFIIILGPKINFGAAIFCEFSNFGTKKFTHFIFCRFFMSQKVSILPTVQSILTYEF